MIKTACGHCKTVYDIDPGKLPPNKTGKWQLICKNCRKPFDFPGTSKEVVEQKPAESTGTDDPFWSPPTIEEQAPVVAAPPVETTPPPSNDSLIEGNAYDSDVKAEFGSMDDYDLSGGDAEFQLESTHYQEQAATPKQTANVAAAPTVTKKNTTTTPTVTPPTVAPAPPTDDIWSQMQPTTGTESGAPPPPPEPETDSSFNEADMLAGLEQEKMKVAAESRRLESVSQIMGSTPGAPRAPIHAPTPKPKTAVPAVSQSPAASASKPAAPIKPKNQSAPVAPAPLQPAVEQLAESQQASPVDKPAAARRAPQPARDPMAMSGDRWSNSATHSIPPIAPTAKNSHSTLPIVIFSVGITLLISGGGFWLIAHKNKKDETRPFASSALEAGKNINETVAPKVSLNIVEKTPSTDSRTTAATVTEQAAVPPTTEASPTAAEDTRSAYERGLAAYQEHSMESYRESESQLLKAFKDEDKSPRTVLALAELYAVLGGQLKNNKLLKKSFQLAQSMVNQKEVKGLALRALAQSYLYAGQHKLAFETIQQSLALDPKDKEAFLVRGLAMAKLGQGGAGILQAYKMDPPTFRASYEMANFFLEAQKYYDAKKAALDLAHHFPLRREGYIAALKAMVPIGQYKEAQKLAEQALQTNPADIELNILTAQIYAGDDKPEKAKELLRVLLAQKPKTTRDDLTKIYSILGKATIKSAPAEAIFYYEQLLKWDYDTVGTLNYLGLAHFGNKQYQQSADYFARALKRSPNSMEIKFNLALTHFNAGSMSRAEQLLNEICATQPKHEDAHFYLAALYEKRGDRNAALQGFSKVLAINPRHQEAKQHLNKLKTGN